MKKLIIGAMAVAMSAAVVCGCKSIPSVDTVENLSTAIGYASGYACELSELDNDQRNAILDVIGKVEMTIPQTNETFEAAWMPIAKEHTQKLIDKGTIDAKEGELVVMSVNVACKGLDYLFEVRHPEWKQYEDLVSAAVHGFCNGFCAVIKPSNGVCAATANGVKPDVQAYEYLMASKALNASMK